MTSKPNNVFKFPHFVVTHFSLKLSFHVYSSVVRNGKKSHSRNSWCVKSNRFCTPIILISISLLAANAITVPSVSQGLENACARLAGWAAPVHRLAQVVTMG